MQIETRELPSALDSYTHLVKKLSDFKEQFKMSTEDFFYRYEKGTLGDQTEFIEWANAYRIFLEIREQLESQLRHVAGTRIIPLILCEESAQEA